MLDRRRIYLFVFACLYTFLFVGSFYGWGPMQVMLEDNGAFYSKCSGVDDVDRVDDRPRCNSQAASLANVNFVAQTTQFISPLLGYCIDRFGAPSVAYFMATSMWVGLIILVASMATAGTDWLLYPAIILTGFTTWSGSLLSIQTGMLYFKEARTQSRVIVILNALFDAGPVAYLGLWGVYKVTNLSVTGVISLYFGLSVVCFGGGIYFWTTATKFVPGEEIEMKVEKADVETAPSASVEAEPLLVLTAVPYSACGVARAANDDTTDYEVGGQEANEKEIDTATDGDRRSASAGTSSFSCNEPDHPGGYVILSERSFRGQFFSCPYILLALLFGIQVTSQSWYFTTMKNFLDNLGDHNGTYLSICMLIIPVAPLATIPLVDVVLASSGFTGGFFFMNLLALSYNVIKVSTRNLNVQVFACVVFVLFRGFLFGVSMSFLPHMFSPDVVGKLSGILRVFPGILTFLNIPLTTWTESTLGGNYFWPNLIYLLLVVPCFAIGEGLRRAIHRDDLHKRNKRGNVQR